MPYQQWYRSYRYFRVSDGSGYSVKSKLEFFKHFLYNETEGGENMFDKVIFHIDVNSAFLSWEAVYRMEVLGGKVDLRKKVCAVGGDVASRRGIILAKSIGAKIGLYGKHRNFQQ